MGQIFKEECFGCLPRRDEQHRPFATHPLRADIADVGQRDLSPRTIHHRFTGRFLHIDRVCQMAGNCRHAALGTDLDGGFGKEQSPVDVDTIADLQSVPGLLRKRGYSEDDIRLILHGNWVRFFSEAWQR